MVAPFCVGEWLPSDEAAFFAWMAELDGASGASMAALHPVVQQFQACVVDDPALFALVNQMFEQLPREAPYDCDPTGQMQVRSFAQLLRMVNTVLTTPPWYNPTGITGLPINAMLARPMATVSGHAVFLHPQVNLHLRRILSQWGRFLKTAASLPALSEDPRTGWFGADAMAKMPLFDQEFECNPALPYRGFKS